MKGFEELYRQYFENVFRFLRGLSCSESLAEELTEETFFRAMKGLDHFRGGAASSSGCARSPRTATTPT